MTILEVLVQIIFFIRTNSLSTAHRVENVFNDHFPIFVLIDKIEPKMNKETDTLSIDYHKLKRKRNTIYSEQHLNTTLNNRIDE